MASASERFFLASDRSQRTGVYVVEWTWFVEQFVRVVCQDDITSQLGLRLLDGEALHWKLPVGVQQDELIPG
jgi:hypothetical protein